MAKLTKKTVDKILDDFKTVLFISNAIEMNKVRPFDFYDYLNKNPDAMESFEEIDKVNNIFKEAQIEQKVYSSNDLSRNILIEMIKVKDKEKYHRKIEIDTTTNVEKLSDEDIAKQIKIIQDKINNKGLK